MPELDGVAATREIRARLGNRRPDYRRYPNALHGDREACLAAAWTITSPSPGEKRKDLARRLRSCPRPAPDPVPDPDPAPTS